MGVGNLPRCTAYKGSGMKRRGGGKHPGLPHVADDAWYRADSVKVSYETSFTRYFYQPKPMRTLAEIRVDILSLEKGTEGLLDNILRGSSK